MSSHGKIFLALVIVFVFGLGYIVWAGRPVVQLREERQQEQQTTIVEPEKVPITEPTEQPQAEEIASIPEPTPTPTPAPAPTTAPAIGQTKDPLVFTMAEVAAHNTPDSCWSAINGSVYDLTFWISRHPGGPGPIKGLCGTDGSTKFTAKHGRSSAAQAALILLKIGALEG